MRRRTVRRNPVERVREVSSRRECRDRRPVERVIEREIIRQPQPVERVIERVISERPVSRGRVIERTVGGRYGGFERSTGLIPEP